MNCSCNRAVSSVVLYYLMVEHLGNNITHFFSYSFNNAIFYLQATGAWLLYKSNTLEQGFLFATLKQRFFFFR